MYPGVMGENPPGSTGTGRECGSGPGVREAHESELGAADIDDDDGFGLSSAAGSGLSKVTDEDVRGYVGDSFETPGEARAMLAKTARGGPRR